MPVRSKTLHFPTVLSAADASMYVVPADETTLVKCIAAYNTTGAAQSYVVGLRDAGSGTTRLIHRRTLAANESVDFQPWWALQPGVDLRAYATVASAIVFGAWGAELEGVAD